MTHGRAAVGVVHRLIRSDRPVTLELTPLCTWRDVHGERFAGADPAVEQVAGGFVFEGAYRVPGPAGSRAAPGTAAYAGARRPPAASATVRTCGPPGRSRAELEPGDELEVTAAAAPFDDELPAGRAWSCRRRGPRAADVVAARARDRPGRRSSSRSPRTSS